MISSPARKVPIQILGLSDPSSAAIRERLAVSLRGAGELRAAAREYLTVIQDVTSEEEQARLAQASAKPYLSKR